MKTPILSYITFGLFIFITFSFAACNATTETKQVETKNIFADFYVRYFQTEKLLKGQVTFGEGDTISTTKPIEMARVNFMNSGMTKKNLLGKYTRYMYQAPVTQTQSEFKFNFTDKQGQSQEQTLKMEPINDFSFKGDISKSKGMVLQLDGTTLSADEQMILLFNNDDNKVATIDIGGPSTNQAISFTGEQLNGLSLGKNQLYLVKKQIRRFQKDNYKMSSIIEFYSNTIEVEVVR